MIFNASAINLDQRRCRLFRLYEAADDSDDELLVPAKPAPEYVLQCLPVF